LLEQVGFKGKIDLLSIDIDGNDCWVWQAIAAVNPWVVLIEYNATLHPSLSVVVPYAPTWRWDESNYFGASLEDGLLRRAQSSRPIPLLAYQGR